VSNVQERVSSVLFARPQTETLDEEPASFPSGVFGQCTNIVDKQLS